MRNEIYIDLKIRHYEAIRFYLPIIVISDQVNRSSPFTTLTMVLCTSDTYDAVVTSGSFIPGHVNEDCYEELIRIIKPGRL